MNNNKTFKVLFKNARYLGLPDNEKTFLFKPGINIQNLLEGNDICFKRQGVSFVIEGHLEKSSYVLKDGDEIRVIPIIVGG